MTSINFLQLKPRTDLGVELGGAVEDELALVVVVVLLAVERGHVGVVHRPAQRRAVAVHGRHLHAHTHSLEKTSVG